MLPPLIQNPPPWPNGARCAVCFSFDMDVESLLHLNHREAAPSRLATSSALRYGPFVAIPRIIDIFRHYGIRQTVFVPGWCIEAYPHAIEALVEAGHEIGHHGWLHERPNTLSPGDEARVLDRALEAFDRIVGSRPTGYRAPAYALSEHTPDLLVERGFTYDASLLGDDVPYLLKSSKGTLVELPSDFALDDWVQYVNMKEFGFMMPIQAPERAMEVFRAEFDAAWTYGGLWVSVWHPFVSGRLARADAMARLIQHMMDKGDVWFAPMTEIAAHVQGLVDRGEWTPRTDEVPFWAAPVDHLVTPSRG
ncbi:polysaccharide deacetylase [Skermanella aerolata]|uniref:Chitooligosaccharide deacetylase n=1 Tax=Skermanella aerolata TaxID=393310 RepID=A0A512DU27_9PROT|nr:polysaccharide deacetylase [Skermanella aerolata]KJB92426.1 ribulose-5-phosphate 3-epimerase [Skermanella aerolata KACC 11604]GEO39974.1 polysaccharide deacetylase [Skermanella aerolata]